MKLHLIQPREEFGPPERVEELRECWAMNDLVFEEQTHPEGRPTFTELFSLCKPDRVNVIANSDIYFRRDNIALLTLGCQWPFEPFALSRWDVRPDGRAKLWDHRDSQDAWIIYGEAKPIEADFPMGVAGCDNRLARVLQDAGYTVTNPSKTIRAYHLHNVAYRSYLVDPSGKARGGDKIERVPGPYAFIQPTTL